MRWGAVLAGAVLATGLWILLQTLGMGVGLSAVETDDAGNLKGIGIGTGIWSVLAPLIAIFIGAYFAGRLSATRDRKVGAMHGAIVWALSTLLGLWAVVSLISGLASGAMKIGGAAASAGATVVSGAARAGGELQPMQSLGIDTNDLLGPINQRLQEQGKPTVTADELNATMRAVAQRGVREGELDRNVVVEELARNTKLSRADSEDVANHIMARYQAGKQEVGERVDQAQERAKDVALEAADKTGKALLAGGVMMLLSLAAAIAGGAIGVPRYRERTERADATPRTEVPPTASDVDRGPIES